MTVASKEIYISPIGILRCLGMGVATVELVFLVGWAGMALSMIGGLQLYLPALGSVALNSLTSLGIGTLMAAAGGAVCGLVTALSHNLINALAFARSERRSHLAGV